jgi:ribose 5-phosphate isomerase RpiB
MSKQDEQLISAIVQQVLAVLRERGVKGTPRADIRPPLGTCTGDYSKFPELNRCRPALNNPGGAKPQAALVLTGIVTANQLQQAIGDSVDGVATLAAEARLTPLANDFARQHPQKIRRASAGGDAVATSPSPAALPWLWWIEGACPVVQKITSERHAALTPMSSGRVASSLGQVIRDLAGSIKAKTAQGGLLFVPNAARAMCMANRCPSLRAVVGTCTEAVEQGVRELGANVLVIEYVHHGPRAMEAMVDRMLQQSPSVPPAVQRELADLNRCG